MPVLDGFSATESIKSDPLNPNHKTCIVAMTANTIKGDQDRCFQVGMRAFLSKPVTIDKVLECIRTWMGKQDQAKGITSNGQTNHEETEEELPLLLRKSIGLVCRCLSL